MQTMFTILLMGLIVCACSREHNAQESFAFDRIPIGRDVRCGAYVLHFDKRDGSSVEGVRIVSKEPGGQTAMVTAGRGSLSQDTNHSSITLILYDAHLQKGQQKSLFHEMRFNLLQF